MNYRVYEREYVYEEVKMKLILNLKRAKELALIEGIKILSYYTNLAFYLDKIGFGKIKNLRSDNKRRRYKTVDHLL